MSRPDLTLVVGARPNFVKAAPVMRAAKARGLATELVHTGQHYDRRLSDLFRDLGLPQPDLELGVGSGSHARQTARVMERLEPVLVERRPARLVVFGDVNSTVAAALVAVKLGIPVAHVEAGLRSFDDTMPEEINRRLTDVMSDLLFTTEASAERNLTAEGVAPERIRFVGNTMVDSLLHARPAIERGRDALLHRLGVAPREFGVLTLHRPANVDDPQMLAGLMGAVAEISERLPILFAVHPRTRERLGDLATRGRIAILEPLGYLDFLRLVGAARLVLTDSGGIQEETTVLGVPCLTLRDNTERPVTIERGTNRLVGREPRAIADAVSELLDSASTATLEPPELWDGRAAERIARELAERAG